MTRILGRSPAIQELNLLIERVAGSKTNVLIIGESGTGKELVARTLHDKSARSEHPFVSVNCGAIPENLIETELFGHHRGSFTGAVSDKRGLFEVAHQGTLFLDEVGELSLAMQVKLLRVIQERAFRKVGGVDDVRVDVRIIAATNRDLDAAVRRGTFREDLYYRLNVILIKTPSLRDRKGDVKSLAEHFLKKFAQRAKKDLVGIDPGAMSALEAYAWPGNVRELENSIERAVTMESSSSVTLESLPDLVKNNPRPRGSRGGKGFDDIQIPSPDISEGPVKLEQILDEVERSFVLAAMSKAGGVKRRAAELLGITFRSLRYRLKRLGLDSKG